MRVPIYDTDLAEDKKTPEFLGKRYAQLKEQNPGKQIIVGEFFDSDEYEVD